MVSHIADTSDRPASDISVSIPRSGLLCRACVSFVQAASFRSIVAAL
jgi:hypothetical protein